MIGENDVLGRKLLRLAHAELAELDYAIRLTNDRLARLNDRRANIIAQIQRLEGARTIEAIING